MAIVKWFRDPFATLGDKIAVPDAIDPSGYVTYQQGYGPDYERVLATDPLAKAIERQKLNQVLYDITSEINTYYMQGFPDYVDATTNGGTAVSYAFGAIVRWTDGRHYFNTVASNTNDPATSGWILYEGTSTLTRNFSTDADITLTAEELSYGRYIMTDSGAILTATRNVIVSTLQRTIFFHNSTAKSLIIKTSAGTGVTVSAGQYALVACDGANVVYLFGYASDTQRGIIETATSTETITGTDTTRAVTPAGLQAKVATTSEKGIVELATDAETITGTDGTRAVTPFGLKQVRIHTEARIWHDVTASRVVGTTYTNTTGYPMIVHVNVSVNTTQCTMVVQGFTFSGTLSGSGASYPSHLTLEIPVGATYKVSNGSLNQWYELYY